MASVAICPHCYLQLSVPDHAESDARLRCPTCQKEFKLGQAVLRTIPNAMVVEIDAAESDAIEANALEDDLMDSKEQADQGIAAWFGSSETVADIPAIEKSKTPLGSLTGDDLDLADEMLEPVVEPLEEKPARPAAVTLADLQRAHEPAVEAAEDHDEPEIELADDEHLGPSFDLPNVPLARETSATIDLPAGDEFEMEDIDFDLSDDSWSPNEAAEASDDDYAQALASAATVADGKEIGAGFDAVSEADSPISHSEKGAAPGEMPTFIKAAPIETGRRRSLVRTLVGATIGGFIGLALGYYALMYLLGPTGDFLQVAHYLPQAALPGSFKTIQRTPRPIVVADETATPISQLDTTADTANESPNVPATFVAPVDPSESEAPAADNRYSTAKATEPSPLDDPLAEPLTNETPAAMEPAPTATAAHVADAPSYTSEQLSTAIDAGRAAAPGLVAGDLGDASVRRAKGMSYAKLCDLAEALTFYDATTVGTNGPELQQTADDLFRETLTNPHTRDEVARIAAIWIDSPHRRHGGVFLTGNIGGGDIAGSVYEYRLTGSDGSPLVVLMPEPLDARLESAGQAVVVVGSIVDHPTEKISGYTGSAPRAVWASHVLPLQ